MEKFYEAYHWLDNHPIFEESISIPGQKILIKHSRFQEGLYMMVVKVDIEKEEIMEEESRNTETRVWLEHGPFTIESVEVGREWRGCSHDIDLDCGGATFEEAIIELAKLVKDKYGDYDSEE